jgi:hypothetical protein
MRFRRTYRVSQPPMLLETKRRATRWYLGLLLVGILACIGLTYFPAWCTTGPQVIPWLVNQIAPGVPTPAQAARIFNTFSTNGAVTGAPSLSPAFLNQVLALAHSPAQGTGQALYDLSRHYQIDDAYALAFFKAESQYGTTGTARVTRSLGNIRCAGYSSCINGYRAYTSYQQGYQDWYRLIRNLYVNTWHLVTVSQIIPVYAPASDGNNPSAYIALVTRMVTQWRKGEMQA